MKATHMISEVALLQPTQLGIISTSSQYLGRRVMQDKGAHLKAQMWQLRSEIDNINKITLEVRNITVVGFI